MPKNRTIDQWLESITNPQEKVSKNDLKKRIYNSLRRKSTGKVYRFPCVNPKILFQDAKEFIIWDEKVTWL